MLCYKCCSAATMFPCSPCCTVCEAISKFISNSSWTSVVTFDFEFICEYCVAPPDNKNWMNKFNFERWIEIKLQLSSRFRLCNLPSSKDFNENTTEHNWSQLKLIEKTSRVWTCLASINVGVWRVFVWYLGLMEKLAIISLLKQTSVS